MQNTIKLKMARFPKAIGDLMHSNQFLKMSVFFSYGLCTLMMGFLYFTLSKAPVVLTLANDATILEPTGLPKAETQIEEAIKAYINLRYKWEPQTVIKRLESARAFILPANLKAFDGAVANVSKFSIEKAVSQKIYPEKPLVNLEKKTVNLSGDRVTAIQGLKAAGNLKLELSFESGPRTKANPWGVYVTREREE